MSGHTAVSGVSEWQLVVASARGQVLVPDTGLRAMKSGLRVVRPGGRTVQSWPWAHVLDLRVGSAVSQPCGEARRLVELHLEGGRHLFVCSATELATLRSSLERHAPRLCDGVPAYDTKRARIIGAVGTVLRVPSPASRRALPLWLARHAAAHSSEGALRPIPRLRERVLRQVSAVSNWREASLRERLAPLGTGIGALALLGGGVMAGTSAMGSTAPAASRTSGTPGSSIMARMGREYGAKKMIELPVATTTPAPAPPSLAGSPVLKSHEIFGFAPYWTLPEASAFNVSDLTTLAYFSIDVNGDGSINRAGSGWVGYESQDLVDLINRAHEAGDRVVLTTTCFGQTTLNALTSNPAAPATLASSLVDLIGAKNLDGVNFDFEGQGSQDQAGLDRLVSQVSAALHGADPRWQVTMDTYASAAGDPGGFYDIAGLARSVDAFFVMAYDMDDSSTPSPTAALTGPGFTDVDALQQYTSVVPPSKVILGVPYYGYDWPTTGPAQGDPATGGPTPVSYAQIVSADHPVYWDPVTQTPWTSYQLGAQWHQVWFDDATSLALKAQLADSYHIAGLGVWALGMDGNDPSMIAALLGNAPVVKNFAPAPAPATQNQPLATPAASQPGSSSAPTSTTNPSPSSPSGQKGPASSGSTTTTTTTSTTNPAGYSYTGTWDQKTLTLDLLTSGVGPIASLQPAGNLNDFSTNDPTYTCLESGPPLPVYLASDAGSVYVVEANTPADCAQGVWELSAQPPAGGSDTSKNTTSTSTSTTTTPTTAPSSRSRGP